MTRQYWLDQHLRGDLASVGQSSLPNALNEWLYKAGARNLDAVRTRFGIRAGGARVYDVGAGTGYWCAYWLERGAAVVDGMDLVPMAVERLRRGFGAHGHFEVADIGTAEKIGRGSYDIVSVMNVLLHIADDARFEHALRAAASVVRPGGYLIIADPVVRKIRDERVGTHSRIRAQRRYDRVLAAQGMVPVTLAPTTALGADPIQSPGRTLFRVWWAIVKLGAKGPGWLVSLIGHVIFLADPVLLTLGAAPSGRFAVFRRPIHPPEAEAGGPSTGGS